MNSLLPGGVRSVFSSAPEHQLTRASGCRYQDEQRTYVDFICGYGAVLLGHAHPAVNRAVCEQLDQGTLFPTHHAKHSELRQALAELFPGGEQALFLKTGSEGVMAAIRLARAFTTRDVVVRCGFHGWHDALVAPYLAWHVFDEPLPVPVPVPGVPEAQGRRQVQAWNGGDIDQLEALFAKRGSEIAAILLDPIQLRDPDGADLVRLRKIADQHGSLLILDELKTGFRVARGGVQQRCGVRADLTILGKSVSNGLPLAIVLGRADILEMRAATRIMGTYNGELASIAAAIATLKVCRENDVPQHVGLLGQRFLDGINAAVTDLQLGEELKALPYRWPCMPYLWISPSGEFAPCRAALFEALARRGVLMLPNHPSFISYAHQSADIDLAVAIIRKTLAQAIQKRPLSASAFDGDTEFEQVIS